MNELVVVEGILGTSSVDANMIDASTSQPKSKDMGKKKKDFIKQEGKQIALGVANKGKKRTMPKESVSIVARKVIGRGIVQNSELPRIRA